MSLVQTRHNYTFYISSATPFFLFICRSYLYYNMVFLALLLGSIAFAPTVMNIGSKITKFYGKSGNLGRAATFGVGYGGGTAVGFNLIPQFGRKSTFKRSTVVRLDKKMPYNRSYSNRYSRYSRYPRRTSRYSRYRRRPAYRSYRRYY